MSTGSSIPYHLRQNKAIDRNLFIDLLSRAGRFRNISDYEYIGFGGPFLEDFKQLHASLRLGKMISIDESEEVVKRQEFNRPLSCIQCLKKTSGEFIREYDFIEPAIVWLDYTRAADLPIQLGEVQVLVSKLKHGDIFKITLNASPEPLGKPSDPNADLRTFRLDRARERLTDYCPADASVDDVTTARYPQLLSRAIEQASKKGLAANRSCVVEILSSFVYADGQQMLTVTAIVLAKADVSKFFGETRLKHWKFFPSHWDEPKSITMPNLSAKERLLVESMLPEASNAGEILAKLGFHVTENPAESTKLVTNFLQFYRLYPWYSRISL